MSDLATQSKFDLAGHDDSATATASRAASAPFKLVERHRHYRDASFSHQLHRARLDNMIAPAAADAHVVTVVSAICDRIEPVANHALHWNIL